MRRPNAWLSPPYVQLAVCCVLVVGIGSVRAEVKAKKKPKPSEPFGTWLTFEQGMKALRATRRPALVWYRGESPATTHFFEKQSEQIKVRRLAEKFVWIRLEKADLTRAYPPIPPPPAPRAVRARGKKAARVPKPPRPPKPPKPAALPEDVEDLIPLRKVWRIPSRVETFLIVDFRERVVRRYDGEHVPAKGELDRVLKEAWARHRIERAQAAKIEALVRKSRAKKKAKKIREAVRLVLPLDPQSKRQTLEAESRKLLEDLLREYREAGRKTLSQADKNAELGITMPQNSAKAFDAALKLYEEVVRDYPFPDLIAKARKGKAVVLSYLQGPGVTPTP